MRRSTLLLSVMIVGGGGGCARSSPPNAPMGGSASASSFSPSTRGAASDDVPTTPPDPCLPLKEGLDMSATHFDDLAICQESAGQLVDALRSSQRALAIAIETQNAGIMSTSRRRVQSLLDRIPHVTFNIDQQDIAGLTIVQFDGRPVPTDALTRKFSVDPGMHVIEAFGRRQGRVVRHVSKVQVSESELVAVQLSLK